MSFLFNADGDIVTSGTPTITNPHTVAEKVKLVSTTGNRQLFEKGTPGGSDALRLIFLDTNDIRVRIIGTVDWVYDATLVQATGVWYDVAYTFDPTAGANEQINIYLAVSGGPLAELSYTGRTDGLLPASSAGMTTYWGNNTIPDDHLNGHLAFGAIWNRVLTLNQLRAYFYNPLWVGASCITSHLFGINGTGTQQDYSGAGNVGTPANVTVSSFPPMLNPFRILHRERDAIVSRTRYVLT